MVMRWRRPTLAWRQGSELSTKTGSCCGTPIPVILKRPPLNAVVIGWMCLLVMKNEKKMNEGTTVLGRNGGASSFLFPFGPDPFSPGQPTPVFPSVQSVRLSPRTGRTPSWRPLPGTDAGVVLVVRPDLCPGRTAGPYRCLSLCFIFKSHEY